MKKTVYDDDTRAAFMKAAKDARAENKPWEDVLVSAESAGYRGTLGGIKQFLFKAAEKESGETPKAGGKAPKAKSKTKIKAEVAKVKIKINKAVKSKKRSRIMYDADVTTAILKAVKDARATGKWNDAHAAATAAGYKGGLASLTQFVESKSVGSTKRKPGAKPKANVGVARKVVVAEFGPFTIPDALRSDFEALLRSKIESEFGHTIKEKNVGKATAAFLEIIETRNAMESKIAALKKM